MWRYFIPIALIVLLMAFFWRGLYLNPGVVDSPLIGKPVPAFSLPAVADGSPPLTSEDFKGHVSVLNVWATWCIPCREESATLVQFSKSKLVPVYGLLYKDQRQDAEQWLQEKGNPYQLDGFDPKGQVALNWGVYGVPETFVVDANGVIRKKYVGPLTDSIVKDSLIPLVNSLNQEKP
ncbi:MAG: DsbE family thiol:disulfide interchange protein [Gammaproteobacteria bacterium]|nr:DsbE family thiol:disulfide interchange protein [Gammaproteobacteria bacterium]MDE2345542.1 DsbE family thiol:disulfide interchange protein [Gammaproteobacteria bacterium]